MATAIGGSDPGVEAAAGSGRAALERMGFTPFLARLDAALAARIDREVLVMGDERTRSGLPHVLSDPSPGRP